MQLFRRFGERFSPGRHPAEARDLDAGSVDARSAMACSRGSGQVQRRTDPFQYAPVDDSSIGSCPIAFVPTTVGVL